MLNLEKMVNSAIRSTWRHRRKILTGLSVALTISAVIEGVKATSEAKDIIDELKYEKFEDMGRPENPEVDCSLSYSEVIRGVWKCYIWTAILTASAIGCGIVSHVESSKEINAGTAAYGSLLETYNAYRDNVRKVVKEKDIQTINKGVAHDIVEKDKQHIPEKVRDAMFNDPGDDIKNLYRDAYSANIPGGYFKRSSEEILRAELDFNHKLARDGYATLNDWYDCLDIGHSEVGDYYGWRYDPNGPMFATTVTDDYVVTRDKYNVVCLGLGYSRYSKFIEYPKNI